MTLSKKDNRIGKAKNLGTLSSPLSRKGVVGRLDKLDFFKFSITGSSNFSASLTKLKGNVDLFLLDGGGRTIAQSKRPKAKPEAIKSVIGEGTYYLKVQSRTTLASTPYRLKLFSKLIPGGGEIVDPGKGGSVKVATPIQFTTIPGSTSSDVVSTITNGDTTFFRTIDRSTGGDVIYVYRNNALQQLTNPSTQSTLEDTYGSRAVWSSNLSTVGRELFLYDGNTTRQLTNSVSDTPEFLDMDGSRVFWLNTKPGGLKELYMNDGTQDILLGTNVFLPIDQSGKKYIIQGKQGLESEPSNTSVVWQAFGGSDGGFDRELFLFDGNIGQTVQLTVDDTDKNSFLKNSGSNIVFETENGLSFYNGTSRQVVPIPNSRSTFVDDI